MNFSISRFFAAIFLLSLLAGCTQNDRMHKMVVSVPDQRMRVFKKGHLIAEYPVSTSKFGLGNRRGSNATPLGRLQIKKKIGDGAPLGAVFKSRRRTGEILRPNSPGRDPIVTRIMWLDGLEPRNASTFSRTIYIHGTPEEWKVGTPASYGCIRMRSRDVAQLYDIVGVGAEVNVVNAPLRPSGHVRHEVVSAAMPEMF
jgi:lipoprotein-anchoring transpeptidase ErfK/SrfK